MKIFLFFLSELCYNHGCSADPLRIPGAYPNAKKEQKL